MDDNDASQSVPDRPTTDEPPSSGAPDGAAVAVDVTDAAGLLPDGDRSRLSALVSAACGALGVRGEVRIDLVDDAAMTRAHERYSGVAGTTDVLTFDLAGDGPETDVDLMLCVEVARRESAARGHGVVEELTLYAVHGLLHTLGHDDHDERAAERMHAEEDRVLTAIGVGPVYAGGGAP